MIRAYFYNADCADAFRIEYLGDDSQVHNVMIDGGFSATYRQILREELNKIDNVDLWIVTHIHDDHLNGVIAYIKEINQKTMSDKVHTWFYNLPRWEDISLSTSDISVAAGIRSNDTITRFLIDNRKNGPDIVSGTFKQIAGLKLQILSPNKVNLTALRSKYSKPHVEFEHIEEDTISSPMAAKSDDYDCPLEDFTLDKFEEDENIENGSCIAMLTSYEDKKILWLSDAHPSTVITELTILGFSCDNPLCCDLVQVAHHGSKLNNSLVLFEMIKCKTYIFSTNGSNKYYLPSKLTLARILRNSQRDITNDRYQIHFTTENETLRRIFTIDSEDIFDRLNFDVHYNNSKAIIIDL